MLLLLITLLIQSEDILGKRGRYIWMANRERSAWSPCTAACGEGFTESFHKCFDIFGGEYVDGSFCDLSNRPSRRMKCEVRPCSTRKTLGYWYTSPWGRCSVTCGRGISSRLVACIRHNDTEFLGDVMCPPFKPKSYKVCEALRCPLAGHWAAGDWSECSSDCGSTRTRTVQCHDDNRNSIPETYCTAAGAKPSGKEICFESCVRWITGPWRKCKYNKKRQSCMNAKQSRCVICIHKQSFQVSEGCNPKTKPNQKRNCALQACAVKAFR